MNTLKSICFLSIFILACDKPVSKLSKVLPESVETTKNKPIEPEPQPQSQPKPTPKEPPKPASSSTNYLYVNGKLRPIFRNCARMVREEFSQGIFYQISEYAYCHCMEATDSETNPLIALKEFLKDNQSPRVFLFLKNLKLDGDNCSDNFYNSLFSTGKFFADLKDKEILWLNDLSQHKNPQANYQSFAEDLKQYPEIISETLIQDLAGTEHPELVKQILAEAKADSSSQTLLDKIKKVILKEHQDYLDRVVKIRVNEMLQAISEGDFVSAQNRAEQICGTDTTCSNFEYELELAEPSYHELAKKLIKAVKMESSYWFSLNSKKDIVSKQVKVFAEHAYFHQQVDSFENNLLRSIEELDIQNALTFARKIKEQLGSENKILSSFQDANPKYQQVAQVLEKSMKYFPGNLDSAIITAVSVWSKKDPRKFRLSTEDSLELKDALEEVDWDLLPKLIKKLVQEQKYEYLSAEAIHNELLMFEGVYAGIAKKMADGIHSCRKGFQFSTDCVKKAFDEVKPKLKQMKLVGQISLSDANHFLDAIQRCHWNQAEEYLHQLCRQDNNCPTFEINLKHVEAKHQSLAQKLLQKVQKKVQESKDSWYLYNWDPRAPTLKQIILDEAEKLTLEQPSCH